MPSKLINETAAGIRGCVRCGDRRCKVCDFLVEGTNFKSNDTDSNLTLTLIVTLSMYCIFCRVLDVLSSTLCSTITKFRTKI